MATFAYKARNKEGQRVQGTHDASDRHQALLALRELGLYVTELAPLAPPKKKSATAMAAGSKWWWRSSAKDLSLYFRQLQALIKSGTGLVQALNSCAQSAPNSKLRLASQKMATQVLKGESWSEVMRQYPGLFSPLVLALIRSGEVGGFLDESCRKIADYAERDHHIKQTITRETWYPKAIIFAAIFILNIPPLIVAVMQGQPIQPAITRYFLSVATPLLIILGLWLVTSGKRFIMPLAHHLRSLTLIIDQVKLMTPVAGKTVRNLAVAKFCRAFAALNAAGVSVGTSFNLAADACGNEAIAARVRGVIPQVEQGKGITDSLASTRQFQPTVLQMMRTGEISGNFDGQLNSIAEFMEQEGETSIRKSTVVLGILVLLAVGIMVGYFVINFYVGYFNDIFDTVDSAM